MTVKKWVTISENYLSASESSDLALPENAMKKKKKKKENIPQKEKRESMNRIKGIIINIWTHFRAEEEEEKNPKEIKEKKKKLITD